MGRKLGLKMTPWSDYNELLRVYQYAYNEVDGNEDDDEVDIMNFKKWARDQLIIWRVRHRPFRYNVELDATCSLLSAHIMDMNQKFVSQAVDDFDLSCSYSNAVMRLCNVFPYYDTKVTSEGVQLMRLTKKSKESVKSVIVKLDLPQWIIDCRHLAAHSSLPPLSILRQASHIGLHWLKVNFWPRLLSEYDTNRNEDMSSHLIQKLSNFIEVKGHASSNIILSEINKNRQQTIQLIVKLILNKTLKSERKCQFDETDFSKISVPSQLMVKFNSLLQLIVKNQVMAKVLLEFLKIYRENFGHEQSITGRNSLCWFITIMRNSHANEKPFTISKLSNDRNRRDWFILLYYVTRRPDKYTASTLPYFEQLIGGKLNKIHLSHLERLASIQSIALVEEEEGHPLESSECDLKTVDDLKPSCDDQNGTEWWHVEFGSTVEFFNTIDLNRQHTGGE